jgi:putative methyltransferase (TIGR04325 family)
MAWKRGRKKRRSVNARTGEGFPDYATALAACGSGYDDVELARVRAYKSAQYVQKLDSTLWPEQIANTALAAGIATSRVQSRPLRVLDFGGGTGIHFFAASKVLAEPPKWAIVETLATAQVTSAAGIPAFDTIEAAVGHLGGVDLVHTSGAIQYTPNPLGIVDALVSIEAPVFFMARLPIWRGPPQITIQESLLSQNGLGPLPPGTPDVTIRYPLTLVDFDEIMGRVIPHYRPLVALDSPSTAAVINGQRVPGITLILVRRHRQASSEVGE